MVPDLQEQVILGKCWLDKHNPVINWPTGHVQLSRCNCESVKQKEEFPEYDNFKEEDGLLEVQSSGSEKTKQLNVGENILFVDNLIVEDDMESKIHFDKKIEEIWNSDDDEFEEDEEDDGM